MKGVSLLMRPDATSGSAVTPILSAAAQQIGRAISVSSCFVTALSTALMLSSLVLCVAPHEDGGKFQRLGAPASPRERVKAVPGYMASGAHNLGGSPSSSSSVVQHCTVGSCKAKVTHYSEHTLLHNLKHSMAGKQACAEARADLQSLYLIQGHDACSKLSHSLALIFPAADRAILIVEYGLRCQ